jgi:hypothetical protein
MAPHLFMWLRQEKDRRRAHFINLLAAQEMNHGVNSPLEKEE